MFPPATKKIWSFIEKQTALSGFVLIGGSALSLRISHRLSEDLDLAWLEDTLPRAAIDQVVTASVAGFARNDNAAASEEFIQGGLELRDYQQDFLVDEAVKVSFFTANAPLRKILSASAEPCVRVASLAEIFKSKALVSAVRSKSRDWFDLYILMKEHSFSMDAYIEAFHEGGIEGQAELGLLRLCSGIPQRNDEGFQHLVSNAPSLEQMRDFFIEQRDLYERARAANRARNRNG